MGNKKCPPLHLSPGFPLFSSHLFSSPLIPTDLQSRSVKCSPGHNRQMNNGNIKASPRLLHLVFCSRQSQCGAQLRPCPLLSPSFFSSCSGDEFTTSSFAILGKPGRSFLSENKQNNPDKHVVCSLSTLYRTFVTLFYWLA